MQARYLIFPDSEPLLLGRRFYLFGRGKKQESCLDDKYHVFEIPNAPATVSKIHFSLHRFDAEGDYILSDGNIRDHTRSRNGTRLNGESITVPVTLSHNDIISFGNNIEYKVIYKIQLEDTIDPFATI